jgi:hypothetical protein
MLVATALTYNRATQPSVERLVGRERDPHPDACTVHHADVVAAAAAFSSAAQESGLARPGAFGVVGWPLDHDRMVVPTVCEGDTCDGGGAMHVGLPCLLVFV